MWLRCRGHALCALQSKRWAYAATNAIGFCLHTPLKLAGRLPPRRLAAGALLLGGGSGVAAANASSAARLGRQGAFIQFLAVSLPPASAESCGMPIRLIKHEVVPGAAALKSGFRMEGRRSISIGMRSPAGDCGPIC